MRRKRGEREREKSIDSGCVFDYFQMSLDFDIIRKWFNSSFVSGYSNNVVSYETHLLARNLS